MLGRRRGPVPLRRPTVPVEQLPVRVVDEEAAGAVDVLLDRPLGAVVRGRLLVPVDLLGELIRRLLADVVGEGVGLGELAENDVALVVVGDEAPVPRVVLELADLLREVVALRLRLPAGEAEEGEVAAVGDVEQLLLEGEVGPGLFEGGVGDTLLRLLVEAGLLLLERRDAIDRTLQPHASELLGSRSPAATATGAGVSDWLWAARAPGARLDGSRPPRVASPNEVRSAYSGGRCRRVCSFIAAAGRCARPRAARG